jgi:hypothetical protein
MAAMQGSARAIWVQVLEAAYSLAHYLGTWIVAGLSAIVPQIGRVAGDLADPIGVMALLTIAVVLTQVARRIMWIVVVVGWALIAIRVALAMMGPGTGRTV